ncbi:MAG TPA: ABC transporter permease subunit [Anaerolineales bacterium]|nr:ABC transporter permease subunit [Anaerolineales bacterium]
MKKKSSIFRSFRLGLAVLAGLVVYAYGFQVTKVNLEETRSPRRQEQLVRILRALARPDILEYEKEEFEVKAPILVPCPAGEPNLPEPDRSGTYMVLTPKCADPQAEIRVEGFNFEPGTEGPIFFIPPSDVRLQRGTVKTDESGHFEALIELPKRPSEEVQYIRVITRRNVGSPHFTQTAEDTWGKIIETVFLALLATTLGTALAIPVSFFAARNLMKDVRSPLTSISLSILAWPAGIFVGAQAAHMVGETAKMLTGSLVLNLVGLAGGLVIVWFPARWAIPQVELQRPSTSLRLARLGALIVASLSAILFLFLLSNLVVYLADALAIRLRSFGFLGTFISNLGEILGILIILLSAMAGGAVFSNAAGRLGQALTLRLPRVATLGLNLLLATLAGATLAALIGAAINWFSQIDDLAVTFWWPAGIGAAAAFIVALRMKEADTLPVGLSIYYVIRTILNTLRSIEPLIMVIVFAVWVGIGPFAGVLALSLHTIAALAKLYSEQVESILPGPLEAIKATGATRLQTIVYAVVPQIVPPYISFTMYRWDINVRMSTIIGFAGGGGIGFLLQQNINLLNYRAASVQMLAITIVVALMDYISSRLREKVV